jgi:hypothetical protein
MMPNLIAVVLAALAAFIIGFLFHGPLFGKQWMKLAHITPTGNEKLSGMYGPMFWNYVANFVTAYAVGVMYMVASASTAVASRGVSLGVLCGIFAWIGFQVPVTSIEVIWMKRPVNLWLFEAVSALVVFVAIGAIVAWM